MSVCWRVARGYGSGAHGRFIRVRAGVFCCVVLAGALVGCSRGGGSLPSVGMREAPPASSRAAQPRADAAKIGYGTRLVSGGGIPVGGGTYKLGQPYRIGNTWYVPREEPSYNRSGVGSWYGADFHGRATSNGEIYDMYALTAAHPTLPLPSYVTVTNLANNRTILVRVNDRGPFVAGRLIDLSRAGARALDYETQGTANLQVRYVGRAPLSGDNVRERQYLASQPWVGSGSGFGSGNVMASRPATLPVWPSGVSPSAPLARARDAQTYAAEGPAPATWSTDQYRASLSASKAAPQSDRRKDGASSWSAGWGLGLGGE